MMRAFLLCIPLALVCVSGTELTEDPPLAPQPKSGDIAGRIVPAEKVAEIWASNRNTGRTFKAASFDAATGRFLVRGLVGDQTYDIGVRLKDGRVIEGIDLSFVDQRLVRLSQLRRKQLSIPAEEPHQFTQDDADELLKYAGDLKPNDFMDQGRVLYLSGQGPRATMLVELMRTRDFYAAATTAEGRQLIWRIELWYFEYQHGGWERVPNQERVLRRERVPFGAWRKISVQYVPELSVTLDAKGKSSQVEFELKSPDATDPNNVGRPAGTDPNLPSRPRILGLPQEQ